MSVCENGNYGCAQVGKPAAALEDALKAVSLDPKFFRAVSRAATCHCRCVCARTRACVYVWVVGLLLDAEVRGGHMGVMNSDGGRGRAWLVALAVTLGSS